jgi:hypothetical protein
VSEHDNWARDMALVAAELSVAAQDYTGLDVALDKRFWELIRKHPDLKLEIDVVQAMTCHKPKDQ